MVRLKCYLVLSASLCLFWKEAIHESCVVCFDGPLVFSGGHPGTSLALIDGGAYLLGHSCKHGGIIYNLRMSPALHMLMDWARLINSSSS